MMHWDSLSKANKFWTSLIEPILIRKVSPSATILGAPYSSILFSTSLIKNACFC